MGLTPLVLLKKYLREGVHFFENHCERHLPYPLYELVYIAVYIIADTTHNESKVDKKVKKSIIRENIYNICKLKKFSYQGVRVG